MHKLILTITSMTAVVLLLNGCAFVTTYQDYNFCQRSSERNITDESTWVYIPINGTKTTKTIVPLFYDAEIRREPYTCHFTIWGNFKEIRSASVSFVSNGLEVYSLPLDITKMNDEKEVADDKRSLFPAGEFKLPFTWNEFGNLEMQIEFIAVGTNGETVEYVEQKSIKKRLQKRKSNRAWENILHV